jgi:sortase A
VTGWRPEDDETVALRIPPAPPGGHATDPLGHVDPLGHGAPFPPGGAENPSGTAEAYADEAYAGDGYAGDGYAGDAYAAPGDTAVLHGGAGPHDPSGQGSPRTHTVTGVAATDPSSTMRLTVVPPGADDAADAASSAVPPPEGGGRAARRRAAAEAARSRHGRRAAPRRAEPGGEDDEGGPGPGAKGGGAALSRVERRRAERARRPGPGVLISRAVGELFITTGVLMILFVAYQLWWTNVLAAADVDRETVQLQDDWDKGARDPGTFEAGQGFALLHIPTLDVVVPIAEGIDKKRVLDRGMVGHYDRESVPTAMPGDRHGNFGLAGHRNTHGEPFRYINRLKPGDPIVVETSKAYYVYRMTSILPSTSPGNVSVLDPVPPGSGFTGPGRYITLTTCTPEFTSTYRMIVWGKMDEERPRAKGKPDVLVDP